MPEVKKILIVFGTRPEAIKMGPVVKALKEKEGITVKVCSTGQHKEMLDGVLQAFHIIPDYNLLVMKENQGLSYLTSSILEGINKILDIEPFDMVLVHGDTTTAFAASLACFYNKIRVGHVEAGLRTNNLMSPYPEEFNRKVIDIMSDLYFAPTESAKENLLLEGVREDHIFVTGNTVIDALQTTVRSGYSHPELEWCAESKLILVTAHRRENIGEPMRNIFRALRRVCDANLDVKVIYPVHLNPKVRQLATEILSDCKSIHLIQPLDVIDFHNFMNCSYLILTDSGGIQEEAPSLGKPVLVMRDTTERPEGITAGTLRLVGTAEESIFQNTLELLNDEVTYSQMSNSVNPYGDGHAAEKIADIISNMKG